MAPALQQAGLVLAVDVGDLALEDHVGPLGVRVDAEVVVLGRARWRRARRGAGTAWVEVEVADDVAGEPDGVGLVVDRERLTGSRACRRRAAGCARRPSGTSTPTSSGPPARRARRPACFISSAALLVKVMARISNGETPWSRMRWAMRWVSTRVLPEPAPAMTSSGPSSCTTASRWTGFSPSSRSESVPGPAIGFTLPAPSDRFGSPPPWKNPPIEPDLPPEQPAAPTTGEMRALATKSLEADRGGRRLPARLQPPRGAPARRRPAGARTC